MAEGACGPGTAPYRLSVDLMMPCAITGMRSPTHTWRLPISLGGASPHTATVSLALPSMPSQEVVLNIDLQAPLEPRCWLEPSLDATGGASVFGVLYPDEKALQDLWPVSSEQEEEQEALEFIFLLDRSGSMGGTQIRQAADALQLFLRSLPQDCCFDIIGFGSTWTSLFGHSIEYGA